MIEFKNGIVHVGDVSRCLQEILDKSVQCLVTSPPYFGLRDYKTNPVVFGGEGKCNHSWGEEVPGDSRGNSGTPTDKNNVGEGYARAAPRGSYCVRCNAWRGQLGLEPTLDLYCDHLTGIFESCKRVLKDSATLWINLGDTYAGYHGNKNSVIPTSATNNWTSGTNENARTSTANRNGFKPKDLMLTPFRFALEMQRRGFYLRSVMPWFKNNVLPESVQDRPSSAIEYVFMFSISDRYFYDIEAVRVRRSEEGRNRRNSDAFFDSLRHQRQEIDKILSVGGVLTNEDEILAFMVNTEGFEEAHFAVFPTRLIEPMILAGTSAAGECSACGEVVRGSTASCECGAPLVPQVVLDPFGGSGTTAVVAETLGRRWRLVELKEEYVEMMKRRVERHCLELDGMPRKDQNAGQFSLFEVS